MESNLMSRVLQQRGAMAAGILGLLLLAVLAVWRLDPWAERGNGLPASFQLDLQQQFTVDPALIGYRLEAEIPVPMQQVRAIASGPDNRIYVAGDQVVQVFRADGTAERTISLSASPTCLTVTGAGHAEPGRIFVGVNGQVESWRADGQAAGQWQVPGATPRLTSLAVAEEDLFVADAASRLIWRFSLEGQTVGKIGEPDPARQRPAFIVPSPYFDVAIGKDGLLRVVNPGRRQIMTYSYEGDWAEAWGAGGSQLSDFFGCCNPAHFAILPDGRFVTSEKGIPRVKVYSPEGQFDSVVAGPEQLSVSDVQAADPREDTDKRVFDVAADGDGRVLVLDPQTSRVRIYVPQPKSSETPS